MMLASVEEVLARVGLFENTGSSNTAEAALIAATPQIENTLRTPFDRSVVTDWFGGPVRNSSSTPTHPEYVFNLSRGFLDQKERFSVYYSTTREPIGKIGAPNVAKLPDSEFAIDFMKGRLSVFSDLPTFFGGRNRLAVRYTAGFETVAASNGKEYANVPPFLREAAITQAVLTIRVGNLHRKSAERTLNQERDGLQVQLSGLLNNHIRTFLHGAQPERTELR